MVPRKRPPARRSGDDTARPPV